MKPLDSRSKIASSDDRCSSILREREITEPPKYVIVTLNRRTGDSMRPQEAVAWGLVLRPQSMVLASCEPESVAARNEHRLRECIGHELQKVNHVSVRTHAEVRNATAGCEWGLDSIELHFSIAAVTTDQCR